MLILKDEGNNLYKTATTVEPNLNSRSKWCSIVNYINDEAIPFHFTRSNGTGFYFCYKDKWYRLLKHSIKTEEKSIKYTTT